MWNPVWGPESWRYTQLAGKIWKQGVAWVPESCLDTKKGRPPRTLPWSASGLFVLGSPQNQRASTRASMRNAVPLSTCEQLTVQWRSYIHRNGNHDTKKFRKVTSNRDSQYKAPKPRPSPSRKPCRPPVHQLSRLRICSEKSITYMHNDFLVIGTTSSGNGCLAPSWLLTTSTHSRSFAIGLHRCASSILGLDQSIPRYSQ